MKGDLTKTFIVKKFSKPPKKNYESKTILYIHTDEIWPKIDCSNGSVVNGNREPFLFSFAFSSLPGRKLCKETSVKLFKKISESVLFNITIFLKDDDRKPVDFNNETISFTCQLFKLFCSFLYT